MDETEEERKQRIDGLMEAFGQAARRLAGVYVTDAADIIAGGTVIGRECAMDVAYAAYSILYNANEALNVVARAERERRGEPADADD